MFKRTKERVAVIREKWPELVQAIRDLWGEIKWVWREGGALGRSVLVMSAVSSAVVVIAVAFAVAVMS